ncbi:hypothetical protein GIS01_19580 [Aeromonas veronii]|nr:hypothetical protein GIS01_19580 [Aeromonas veronii]
MHFKYSIEAKIRISLLGMLTISEFIDEIPQGIRKMIYKRLPHVQGFRKDTPLEFKEKQKRLIGHIINFSQNNTKNEADWSVFSSLWEGWFRERFGDAIPKIINMDDGGAFLNEFSISYPNASREDAERLFLFSGFADDDNTSKKLASFRPSAEIARARILDEIPERQDKLEEYTNNTKKNIEDLCRRIEQFERSSAKLVNKFTNMGNHVEQNTHAIAAQQKSVDNISSNVDEISNLVEELLCSKDKHSAAILSIHDKVKSLNNEIKNVIDRGVEWDKTKEELSTLFGVVEGISAQEDIWNNNVEVIHTLVERIVALERILAEGNAGRSLNSPRFFERKSDSVFVNISSVDDAKMVISSNLQAVGIAKGKSIEIARVIVTALIAGQLIQFKGSFSDIVADVVAAAISGSSYYEWRVPIGLTSDEITSSCVDETKNTANCLLLKGANLSAFEVYGSPIKDIIIRRPLMISECGNIAFIASWAQGPAAFPDGGLLTELGPVFDTDELPMRGLLAKKPMLQFGQLSKKSWAHLDGLELDKCSQSNEEFREILNEAGFRGSNLWRQIIFHAHLVLTSIPGGDTAIDHHTLLVTWAIPYARATGGSADKLLQLAENELLVGRIDKVV